MAVTQGVNFRGRFEYLEAIEEYWPETLRSLRAAALTPFVACVQVSSQPTPTTYAGLRHQLSDVPCIADVCSAVQSWATSQGIRDRWMFDAAVQTLAVWSKGNAKERWAYTPEMSGEFNPTFGTMWLPSLMTWGEFKKVTDKQYREQLLDYRKRVACAWGSHSTAITQQAIWTVLFQRGKSPGEIRLWEMRERKRKLSEANIHVQVRAFAASIGVTLRPAKHGPKNQT
jgi:hypothetical protein